MDEVFKALADASRRSLLDRLHARNGQTLNDLCDGLAMTRQAVTKHLAILEAANLVTTFRHGREKLHYLNPVPIHQIGERWIKKFERGKLAALSELKALLVQHRAEIRLEARLAVRAGHERHHHRRRRSFGGRPAAAAVLYIPPCA